MSRAGSVFFPPVFALLLGGRPGRSHVFTSSGQRVEARQVFGAFSVAISLISSPMPGFARPSPGFRGCGGPKPACGPGADRQTRWWPSSARPWRRYRQRPERPRPCPDEGDVDKMVPVQAALAQLAGFRP
jgi:hypothetical protein